MARALRRESASDSEPRACNARDTRGRGAGGWCRDARATRAGGSGAPVAASTAASSRSEHATGVTRGRAGLASAQNVPRARAGAAARPLPAKYGRFIAVRACKGRDAARAEGCGSRRTSPLAGMRGRGARDALPHWRGREPRRDRCGRCTAASSRCKRARGVTRRGRVGVRLSLAIEAARDRAKNGSDRVAAASIKSDAGWSAKDARRFVRPAREFRLPALLREVMEARNRPWRRRRDVRGRRVDLRSRRMKAVEHGWLASCRQRESIVMRARLMSARF